jgi:hypothetical protein
MTQVKATVSGSFTRHLTEIQHAVAELKARGVKVLSPEQPTIVGAVDGFLFVASDRHRSVRLVQDRHLASIADSDFLWLENPDGYVGQSAALELGFAVASGIPVYSSTLPEDLTMRQYVTQVSGLPSAVLMAERDATRDDVRHLSLLVDPIAATESALARLSTLRELLTSSNNKASSANLEVAVHHERDELVRSLGFCP